MRSLTQIAVISAIKQHAETGHDIHPIYANILETDVSGKNKRLFLESLHSFLDKNSVNERALTYCNFINLGIVNNCIIQPMGCNTFPPTHLNTLVVIWEQK